MWFIGIEVEQETSAPRPKKNPGSAPAEGMTVTSESSRVRCTYHTLLALIFMNPG